MATIVQATLGCGFQALAIAVRMTVHVV